jgi:hypothetical protein
LFEKKILKDQKITECYSEIHRNITQTNIIKKNKTVFAAVIDFIVDTGKNNSDNNRVYDEVPKKKILIYFKKRHNGKIREIV